MLAILKFTLKIFETKPLADDMRGLVVPTPEEAATDEGLKEYIRDASATVFHPVGTTSMLPREDGGVVDPQLRVYGTANVRVVSGANVSSVKARLTVRLLAR